MSNSLLDCSLPGFSSHGILQASILENIAISYSKGSYQPRVRTQVSCIVGRFYTIWVTIKTEPKWVSEILLLYENFILYFIDVLSHIQLFVTPWTVTHQAPLSMEFSRREFLSGLLFPTPGQSSWPRDWTCISCRLLHWQADSLPLYHLGSPSLWYRYTYFNTLLLLKCKFTLKWIAVG